MAISTQISTTVHAKKPSLDSLRMNLKQLDIRLAHPMGELFFAKKMTDDDWEVYSTEVELFEAIATSSFHVIYNEGGTVELAQALQMLHAMRKQRPVIFTHKPIFAPSVDAFSRQIIVAHLRQCKVINLPSLELAEVSYALHKLPPAISYDLTQSEDVLIHSRVKAYFRNLLEAAKQQVTAIA